MALSPRMTGLLALVAGIGAMTFTIRDQKMRAAQQAAEQAKEEQAAKTAAQAKAPTSQVIALWTGVPVPGEPRGLHVADVSVDTAGAVSLLLSDNTTTQMKVQAAIAQAAAQPALPLPPPAQGGAGAQPTAPGSSARPGDPQYAAAVAQFLGSQTGFKPQLEGH